jgi:hypothetical protein
VVRPETISTFKKYYDSKTFEQKQKIPSLAIFCPSLGVRNEHQREERTEKYQWSGGGQGVYRVNAWFDDLFELTEEMKVNEYWKKARNAVKSRLIESHRNGKTANV